jgi:hypothetical protein
MAFPLAAKIYPRMREEDFVIQEELRNLCVNVANRDDIIKRWIQTVGRGRKMTAGFRSFLLAGKLPEQIFLYPYSYEPTLYHVSTSIQTMSKLRNIINGVKWTLSVGTKSLRFEENSKFKQLGTKTLHNIITNDKEFQTAMQKLEITQPSIPVDRMLINLTDQKIDLPQTNEEDLHLSIIGVSIGYNLNPARYDWFIAIEVDMQKIVDEIRLSIDCECRHTYIIVGVHEKAQTHANLS